MLTGPFIIAALADEVVTAQRQQQQQQQQRRHSSDTTAQEACLLECCKAALMTYALAQEVQSQLQHLRNFSVWHHHCYHIQTYMSAYERTAYR
jgi:hypothetical protein